MSKTREEKIAESKARHPAFQQTLGKQQAFDVNTVIRYDLHAGLFSVSADIDNVDTIYDAKFGGWRKPETDAERTMNEQIVNTLASVCVMLNQMAEVHANDNKENDTNE
jgi:hypothetical protein